MLSFKEYYELSMLNDYIRDMNKLRIQTKSLNESNTLQHFEKELNILKQLHGSDDLIIDDYIDIIKQIIMIFDTQGHSGFSATAYANQLSNTIKNTLMFKPLSPITGVDSEWNEISYNGDDVTYQNNRISAVFKNGYNKQPYYLDAIIWQGENEYDTFSGVIEGIKSRQFIKLPFTPKTFYIDVIKSYHVKYNDEYYEDENGNKYVYKIKDRKQLKDVIDYYDTNIII